MSNIFDFIANALPGFLYYPLWLVFAVVRVFFLLALPPNAKYRMHWANPAYDFLAFEKE